jgi:hypothetical protein
VLAMTARLFSLLLPSGPAARHHYPGACRMSSGSPGFLGGTTLAVFMALVHTVNDAITAILGALLPTLQERFDAGPTLLAVIVAVFWIASSGRDFHRAAGPSSSWSRSRRRSARRCRRSPAS